MENSALKKVNLNKKKQKIVKVSVKFILVTVIPKQKLSWQALNPRLSGLKQCQKAVGKMPKNLLNKKKRIYFFNFRYISRIFEFQFSNFKDIYKLKLFKHEKHFIITFFDKAG